jgi:hypothetical protein
MEAGTVPEKATVSHRGEKYEIGRGKRFYGIWPAGAPYAEPVDRWPETREGWEQAWTRFVALETPGTIAAVDRPRLKLPKLSGLVRASAGKQADDASARRRPSGPLAGAVLLVIGVLLGLIGLFPGYVGGQSLTFAAEQWLPHVLYLAGWAVSAALIARAALRRARPGEALGARPGALLGVGLSAVTLGLLVADLGQVISGGASFGAGLVLTLLGWLAAAVGSLLALGRIRLAGPVAGQVNGPGRPDKVHAGPFALLLLAGIGTAIAFAPSWDSFTLHVGATGVTRTIPAGYAFDNPGMVIAGDVLVMVAVVVMAALAALWRPPRHGAMLLAGVIVPVAAQAISALIQVSHPATPAMFGISSSAASAAGLTIASGVTPVFWVYCVFVISLVISCAWLSTAPQHPAMPGMPAVPQPPRPDGDRPADDPAGDAFGEAVSEAADSDSGAADSDSGAGEGEQSAYA